MGKLINQSFLRRPFDVLIVERGIVDRVTLKDLVDMSTNQGIPLEDILINEMGLPPEAVFAALADSFGLPFTDLADYRKPFGLEPKVEEVCNRCRLLPLEVRGNTLVVATCQPVLVAQHQLELATAGYEVEFKVTIPSALSQLIQQVMLEEADENEFLSDIQQLAESLNPGDDKEPGSNVVDISAASEKSSVVELVNQMLVLAVRQSASDIHLEALEKGARVRFRIDGVLQSRFELQKTMASAVISRVMVMASLDITERVMPQDGSFKVRYQGTDVEFRIASSPGIYDQNLTLRMLTRKQQALGLPQMGMREDEIDLIKQQIKFPHGMMLVSGPTGSGKSTTLYAVLEIMNSPEIKIITIEDPIERRIDGIQQIQVRINRNDPERSLTFARGLRNTMRLDPDVIMVGEIRDKETAEISIQASLTGHLVFSTVHANSSLETIRRLQNMGTDPFLMISSLNLIVAQRLVRRLCQDCFKSRVLEDREKKIFPADKIPDELAEPVGCKRCTGSGYKGRLGIFEFLPITEELRSIFLDQGLNAGLTYARKLQRRTLIESGLELIREKKIDFLELERVVGPCL
ncbi:MAG: type II/IV secretion system protein [Candidatus Riflebacteria bacterium]|nr:type II/IV secretion system protein [Candidatus Riflebacteria bacterium]